MKYHHDIKQGTEEWHKLRLGRLGGSSSYALLVNGRSETGLGAGAMTIICQNAAEIITGYAQETYQNAAMDRGMELEPIARKAYEESVFATVQEIGYISEGSYLGTSPDGLVGDDGMIEIKAPEGPEYVRYSHTREIQKSYLSQMQWGLWITKRKWCDFVVYNHEFPKPIIITRILPDPEIHARYDAIVPVYIKELELALAGLRTC